VRTAGWPTADIGVVEQRRGRDVGFVLDAWEGKQRRPALSRQKYD
jgi:hypothetical protein